MGFRGLRTRGLVALGGLLGALALLVVAGFTVSMNAEAHTPHPGLNFVMVAEGQSGCDTSSGDATCYIPPGTTFAVDVMLVSLPADIPSYEGYDIVIDYTGLTSANDATTASWPDCGFPAQFFGAGKVAMGCTVGLPPAGPSTYIGLVGKNTFTCSNSGTIALHHGLANTILTQTVGVRHAEGANTSETLHITCGPRPAPTNTPLPTRPGLPGTGTGGSQNGGVDAGLWFAIAVLLTAGAAGVGVYGWRYARVGK